MKRNGGLVAAVLVVLLLFSIGTTYAQRNRWHGKKICHSNQETTRTALSRFVKAFVRNNIEMNRNLISMDSLKVFTGTVPFYISARAFDERLQKKFYDATTHINVNQPSGWIFSVANWCGMFVPMGYLASEAFWHKNPDVRAASSVFGTGIFSAWVAKNAIKKLPVDASLRPWHEKFSCEKRALGGFPSGHMVEVAYMTTFAWLQKGSTWGVPLALGSAAIFGLSVTCNRHYASQVIAGTGLGVMYGLAANMIVGKYCPKDLSFVVSGNEQGGMSMGASWGF